MKTAEYQRDQDDLADFADDRIHHRRRRVRRPPGMVAFCHGSSVRFEALTDLTLSRYTR